MAYGVKYRFTFDSEQGTPFRIDIMKDGYSGAILQRSLGGSPVLRRDKSDNICGTSLEIPAECAVDGEFEEFKTSVPLTFRVDLYGGANYGTLVWAGFVTPELMTAPDIAPPYDAQVSCTDGLGELKYTDFPSRGGRTLWDHLQYLLSLTGLSLSVTQVGDLYHGSYTAATMLQNTGVNLDFLAGETCYDVLQYILTALHSTITQYNGTWLIFKETGAVINTSAPSITNVAVDGSAGGHVPVISIDTFGSMATHQAGWWPVGHMSHSNEPPRRRMVLTCENHYVDNLLSDAVWQAVAEGEDNGAYWSLAAAGDGMKQSLSFARQISQKLMLTIRVRNIGSGAVEGKLSVKVKAVGTSYAGNRTYYLANGTYSRRNAKTDYTWSSSEQDCVIDVQAPAPEDTDEDYVDIGVLVPAYRNGERDYFYISSLEITVKNGDGTYPQRVYGVSLGKYERFSGIRKTAELNNGARGDAPDVNLILAAITGNNLYTGVEEMMQGVPVDATSLEKIVSWKSATFSSGMDYLSLMARDYALSVAGARTRIRGTLNVPVGRARIPVAFRDDTDQTYYFIDTLSWSLWDDEMEVEALSRPATSISVSDESAEEGEKSNGTGFQQSDSTSSGGGGTGTVTSVALSIPTYFDISGSPVSTSGTLTATLKSTYKIPSSSEWSNVYDKAHTHSNKSILDTISQSELTAWDNAADKAHTHSNKSVLDQISQNDLTNWDAAYNYMSTLDINSSDIQHWDAAYAAMHSHSNKSVLDGISSADVTSWDGAATNSHTHSNKAVLDTISSSDVSAWDGAATNSHTHANKSVLDLIDQGYIDSINGAISDAHVHSNWSTLDNITATQVSHWDTAYTNNHTHSNKSVLDSITSQKVSQWDGAATDSHTHSNKSVLDGITSAKVSAWDAAALGDSIDISIGGTAAAPTVAVALGTGASDYVALPIAGSSLAGIVTNGAQTIAGAKTFSDYIYLSRIYLGASGSSGAYIEWDNSAHAFKVVGDIYATGDVAAGDD